MNRLIIAASTAICIVGSAAAQQSDTIRIDRLRASEPIMLNIPLMIDSLDAKGKAFDYNGVVEMNRNAVFPMSGITNAVIVIIRDCLINGGISGYR